MATWRQFLVKDMPGFRSWGCFEYPLVVAIVVVKAIDLQIYELARFGL